MKLFKITLAVSILFMTSISFAQQYGNDAGAYAVVYLLQKQAKEKNEAEEKKLREVNYRARIHEVVVKDCSVIVSDNASNELMQSLMSKGYRPVNVLPEYKNSEELTGLPYFEINSILFFGNTLTIGKTGEGSILTVSKAEDLPGCIEN